MFLDVKHGYCCPAVSIWQPESYRKHHLLDKLIFLREKNKQTVVHVNSAFFHLFASNFHLFTATSHYSYESHPKSWCLAANSSSIQPQQWGHGGVVQSLIAGPSEQSLYNPSLQHICMTKYNNYKEGFFFLIRSAIGRMKEGVISRWCPVLLLYFITASAALGKACWLDPDVLPVLRPFCPNPK